MSNWPIPSLKKFDNILTKIWHMWRNFMSGLYTVMIKSLGNSCWCLSQWDVGEVHCALGDSHFHLFCSCNCSCEEDKWIRKEGLEGRKVFEDLTPPPFHVSFHHFQCITYNMLSSTYFFPFLPENYIVWELLGRLIWMRNPSFTSFLLPHFLTTLSSFLFLTLCSLLLLLLLLLVVFLFRNYCIVGRN